MKHTVRKVSSLLLALVVILRMSVTVFAADTTIIFKGAQEGFDVHPGSEYTATDLFDHFKNVMPGDKRKEVITFVNKATDCDYINIYIRAKAHSEEENPLSVNVAASGETVASMSDFLSQLSMKVYNGENMIYDASPDELNGFQDNLYLVTLRYNDTVNLTVELAVPFELGNQYANRAGEVDWVFMAEGLNDQEEPEESPVETPEPLLPPETGDTTNLVLYAVLAGAAGIVLISLLLIKRRRKTEKD